LDRELEHRGLPFVRYADDFVIFTKSARSAQRVFASVSRYLTDHLRLVVNPEKSQVVGSAGVEFLGFVFTGRRGTINVTSKNVSKFMRLRLPILNAFQKSSINTLSTTVIILKNLSPSTESNNTTEINYSREMNQLMA